MEKDPVEEIKALSKEEYLKRTWRGHFLFSPSLDKPMIDVAPVYEYPDIVQLTTEKKQTGKGGKVKIVETACEAYPAITICDVKLNARGFGEDQIYLGYIDILKNIRRGNTYLKIQRDNGTEKTIVGRKGMIKFYDISRDMLEEGAENREVSKKQGNNNLTINKKQHFSTMNVVLGSPYRALKDGYKVEAIKTLKANGENAQIAWNAELRMWVFCSKNVALLAKTPEDVDVYDSMALKSRYNFAGLIAKTWFDKLKEMEENKVDIEEFKKEIAGKTLVGEYCGDPNYRHLVLYPQIKILFYTIVDNHSEHTCILPEESVRIFKKYKVDCVTYETLGVFDNYDDLRKELKKTYQDVAKAHISENEEGSVIYFVRRSSDPETQGEDRVLSLGKMKTLEYRFYRKLREKLSNVMSKTKSGKGAALANEIAKMNKKFKAECIELNQLPGDQGSFLSESELDYYFYLAQAAGEKLANNFMEMGNVKEIYLDFLKELIEELEGSDTTRLTSKIFDIQDQIAYTKPDIN